MQGIEGRRNREMTQAKRTKDKDGEGVESGDPAKTVRDSDRDFSLFCVVQGEPNFPAAQRERAYEKRA